MRRLPEKIEDYLESRFPDFVDEILLADGFEDAFLGVVESFGAQPKACYDFARCLKVLMSGDESMTLDEAEEYMSFNVQGAYVGKYTPAFIELMDKRNGYDDSKTNV
jgi:hypothetical protein